MVREVGLEEAVGLGNASDCSAAGNLPWRPPHAAEAGWTAGRRRPRRAAHALSRPRRYGERGSDRRARAACESVCAGARAGDFDGAIGDRDVRSAGGGARCGHERRGRGDAGRLDMRPIESADGLRRHVPDRAAAGGRKLQDLRGAVRWACAAGRHERGGRGAVPARRESPCTTPAFNTNFNPRTRPPSQ